MHLSDEPFQETRSSTQLRPSLPRRGFGRARLSNLHCVVGVSDAPSLGAAHPMPFRQFFLLNGEGGIFEEFHIFGSFESSWNVVEGQAGAYEAGHALWGRNAHWQGFDIIE